MNIVIYSRIIIFVTILESKTNILYPASLIRIKGVSFRSNIIIKLKFLIPSVVIQYLFDFLGIGLLVEKKFLPLQPQIGSGLAAQENSRNDYGINI